MKSCFAFAALATLVSATSAGADPAGPDTVSVDLGLFMNASAGEIYYDGPYPTYVHASPAPGAPDLTEIKIDLWGIISLLGYEAIAGVTVTDTGSNSYGQLSPGADVDFMRLKNVEPDLDVIFAYEGPNPIHAGESAKMLAQRVASIDSFNGAQDAWDMTHVSLGAGGSLTALFGEPVVDSPDIIGRPKLLLSEAGSFESFRVSMEAVVPAPATPAVLGLAAFAWRRRRRSGRRSVRRPMTP